VKIKINPEIFTAHAQPFTPQESAAPERISDMRSLSLIGQKLREEMTTYAGMLRDHSPASRTVQAFRLTSS
jgi:hypothetical protein